VFGATLKSVTATLVAACWAATAYAQTTAQPAVAAAAIQLLQHYSVALESLDADAVKKVQPSADVATLRNAFRQMRSLEVDIDEITVLSATDGGARVSCRVKQTLVPRAGSKQMTTVTRVLRLKRQQDSWLIETFER
jgi:hypothetical protein